MSGALLVDQPAFENRPMQEGKKQGYSSMAFSFYDPLRLDTHTIYGAAAMNYRLARLGGLNKYTQTLTERVTNMVIADLTSAAQPANDSTVVPIRKKRRQG